MRLLAALLLLASLAPAEEPAEEEEETAHQLVLLLSKKRVPTEEQAAAAVISAFKATRVQDPKKLQGTKGPAFLLVPVREGMYLIAMKRRVFSLVALPEPLFDEDAAKQQENELVAAAIRKHKGVLVLRAGHAAKAKSAAELDAAYDDIGKLAKALGTRDVLAIYVYEARSFHVATAALLTHLGDRHLLKKMGAKVPLNRIEIPVDAELAAAMAEARETLPQFVAAFRAKDGEGFQVKLLLNEGKKAEHIWVNVTKIDDKTVEGTLDNNPFYLKKKMGDSVSAPLAMVSDWLIMRDGNIVGGRTVRILLERQKKQRENTRTNDE